MAEFNTFDLGRVIQTAEAIKGLRRQESDDMLKRQYLQTQLAGAQQQQAQQAETFDAEKQTREARQRYLQLTTILRSADPIGTAKMYAPELIQTFDAQHGTGSFEGLSSDQAKQLLSGQQSMAAARAGIQRKIKYIDSGGQQVPIDEDTGLMVTDVEAIQKTPAPVSLLEQEKFAETKRHNRVTEENAATTTNNAKAPTGYRFKADGSGAVEPIPGGPAVASVANQLRDEYNKASQNFVTIGDSYAQIKSVAKSPSAAGDLSLIFSYMKMLDPGSTVREGEFANAQNAGGIPDRLVAQYNKVLRGERLSEPQRKDFVSQAKTVYDSARARHEAGVKRRYQTLAEKNQLDPNSVVSDFDVPEETNPTAGAITATGPNGQKVILQNGKWVPFGG